MRRHGLHGEVGRRQLDSLIGGERDLASAHFKTGDALVAEAQKAEPGTSTDQFARAQTPGEGGQFEHRQIAAQAHRRAGQTDVGGKAVEVHALKANPGAQGTGAALDVGRVIDPGAPGGQINLAQIRVKLAVPVAQVVERGAVQIGAQIERGGERARWRAGERDAMTVTTIDGDQLNVGQRQLGGLALFVVPAQARFTDHDAPLSQNPVGHLAAVRIILQFQTADRQAAVLVAPDIQIGVGNFKRMQA